MLNTILMFIFIILILIMCHYFYVQWKWRSFRHVNGPIPLPLLGNVLEVGFNPVAALNDGTRLANIYGKKDGIIKLSLLNKCYLLIFDPDITEFFLSSSKCLKKSTEYNVFQPLMRNGLILSTDDYHKKRRKAISPTFHFKILEQFISIFNKGTETLIKRLSKEVDKDVIDIMPYLLDYSLDCICETAMGTKVNTQENPNNEYTQALDHVSKFIIARITSVWKRFDFLFKFSKEYPIQKKSLKIIENFTKAVIIKRRNELLSASVNNEEGNNNAVGIKKSQVLLDVLLSTTIDGKPLNDDEITEEVNTFLTAGHDTIASAVSFALYELSRNPEIQKKAYEETEEVLNADRSPTLSDLNNLKYLELIIKETLRLHSIVPHIGRELQEDVTYNGTTYTKGVQLFFYLHYMFRRSDLFLNPDKFEPERFLPENNTIKNAFSYIPFSAGPRNCIGQKYAMYEIKLVLSKILQNFELLPAGKKYDVILSTQIVLKSANGVSLKLKKRI